MIRKIRKKTAILMTLLLCLSMADFSALITAYAEETEEISDSIDENMDDTIAEEETNESEEETTEYEHSYGEYTLKYTVEDNNAVITGYTGELPSELEIPGTIDGYKVVEIGDHVFQDTDITSVVIPDGVTTIRCYAFVGCEQLVSVLIPDSVVSIERCVFEDCSSLESINIPDSITIIENLLFDGCSSLRNINIPDRVTTIGGGAFAYCKSLESINIPDRVTNIEGSAFEGCSSLKGISMPDSVTSIGDYAFAYCESLESINIPDGVTIIKSFTFFECKQLISVEIPDSVTEIEYHVFDTCESLESINIPNSVIEIGHRAFGSCDALKEVKLPSSLKVISEGLFILCNNLVSVEIPDSVTKIESLVFSGCKSLKTISIPENVSYIGGRAFINSGISEIYFSGDIPEFHYDEDIPDIFSGDTLIAFYPVDNPTWTEDVLQPYGADSIEWIPWNPETEEIQGYIDVVDDSVDGENEIGVHIIGSGDDLVLECNLPLQYFVSVEIDGVTVDPSNYELRSGSTIITFDSSFLDTLTPGNHTVTMHYNINGRKVAVKTSITIKKSSESSGKPSKPDTPSKPADSFRPVNGNNTGTKNETTASSQNKVTMKAYLVDANGQPMYNCTLEIHSKPVAATLGTDGTASFKNIEVGEHTMYLKDQNGKELASKAIKIVHDQSYSITGGDTIHVVKGRAFILNVKYDGENLILLSVEGDQTPATGDTATAHIWILLIALSAAGITLLFTGKRKQIKW